jgi:hypothetical protein
MRSTTLTAAVLAGSAALAVAVAHRRRTTAPLPVDLEQVLAGARRIADVLETGDPIMQGLVTHGSDLVDVPEGFGRLLAGFADPQPDSGGWSSLPIAPLREGVGYLHDWLSSGPDPLAVLRELRDQAPIRPIADLLADIAIDLADADTTPLTFAARLREAEQLLRQAAELVGENDYENGELDPHLVDCPGGCGGTNEVMQVMTWDDQGEGILVPVHQEPVYCRRGEPAPEHPAHCQCRGTGTYRQGGYRELCLHPVPDLAPQGEDPWESALTPAPAIPAEPPF